MVTLTERAAEEIRGLLAQEAAVDGGAESLRVAVQGGGCSGFQYALGFDGPPQPGDAVAQVQGITVVVDRFSLPYLEGAGIDYVDGLMGQGFTVEQPERSGQLRLRQELHRRRRRPSGAPAGPDGCASGCSA